MTAHRNQHKTSPRFPRGLALLSLTGVLFLVNVCLSKRGENEAAADSRAVETHTQATHREHSRLRSSRSPADTFADDLNTRAASGGRAAAARAEQLPAGPLRENALSAVAIKWANTDLNSTVEWARRLPDAAEQQTVLLAAANEAVRTEPLEALRLAVGLFADAGRDEAISRAATEWALHDAASAVDWAKQIPDETLRAKVVAMAAVAWSESAPEAAATLAVETLPAGRLLDDTVVSIIQRWAQTDARAAAAWVERFPESSLRATAIENLLSQWRRIDPVKAQQWQAENL